MRVRWLLLGAAFGVAAWSGGLAWFAIDALRPTATPPAADGIVVLTGDALRVQAALRLLAEGCCRLLLVSGAGPGASLEAFAHPAGLDAAQFAGRVTLGREAVSTWGNGDEFAAWAGQHAIRTALVVTSFYHMRRALLELNRAAPKVRLIAVKVPADPHLGRAAIRKLVDDYDKYLLALIGLSRFSPGHRAL